MEKLTIELPESVTRELDGRRIPSDQVRNFVVQAAEIWLRVQDEGRSGSEIQSSSRFGASATPFAEKLIRENRDLFERLSKM